MAALVPITTDLSNRRQGQFVSGGVFSIPTSDAHVAPRPPVKLSADLVEKSAQRLATQRPQRVKLEPLTPRQVVSKDAQEGTVRRLYEQSVEKRKVMLVQLEKKQHPSLLKLPVSLPAEVVDSSVARLHDECMKVRQQQRRRLAEKHLAPVCAARQMQKSDIAESNDRLYSKAVEKQAETRDRLIEKYLAPLPKTRFIPRPPAA
eukprot:TRINITY_DN8968_c0_g1_i1.p1 TRINITY_DN8968_c0_g1~~TRINITY_DN8968_c0_g1_i1.p1  ORF type:complete len:229 (+),score=111.95 TRINITY_DN8968_c0_g1_i1:78-689(+)